MDDKKKNPEKTTSKSVPEQFGTLALGFADLIHKMAAEKDFQKNMKKN